MCEHNKIKHSVWLLLCLPFLLNSCIEDDEVAPDDYCYISAVSLGTVKRVITTADTTIYTSYTASSYVMSIDQKHQAIENRNPLLYGSDLRAVLLNIAYDGSYQAYRPQTDTNDAAWVAYNSRDSIDLRTPLELYIVSNDSRSSRIYTLKVNVKEEESDSLYWTKDSEFGQDSEFASMTETRAAVAGGRLVVLGRNAAGIMMGWRKDTSDGPVWESCATDLPDDADLKALREHDSKLYISCADGTLYTSDNAETWTRLGQGAAGMHLAGVTDGYYYSIAGGRLYSSADAMDWTREEALDEKADSLPSTVVGTLAFTQPNGNKRLVMVGRNDSGAQPRMVVWNKMWYGKQQEGDAGWMFVNWTRENRQLLPVMEHTSLHVYDGKCLAIGEGTAKMYFSSDYGITWRTDSGLHLPKELDGATDPVTSAVDADNMIWIIAGNQVWRGRLNRLGSAER